MFGVNSLKKWLILCYFHKKRSSFWVFVPKNVYYERVSFPFVTWFCLFYTLMYGSTGPAAVAQTSTYGRKYDTTVNPITLEANIAQDVPLGSNGTSNGITLGTQNKLVIPIDGIYKVEYFFSGGANTNAEVTLNVKQNTNPIGSTTITKNLTANVDTDFVGSTINSFNANDQIGLSIKSTKAVTLSPASDTSAYLNIVKIS